MPRRDSATKQAEHTRKQRKRRGRKKEKRRAAKPHAAERKH